MKDGAALPLHCLGIARLLDDGAVGAGDFARKITIRFEITDQKQIAIVQIKLEPPRRAESRVRRQTSPGSDTR